MKSRWLMLVVFLFWVQVQVCAQSATYSSNVFNLRYCEILLGFCTPDSGGYVLTYSTFGLNDCPETCVEFTKRNPETWTSLAKKWGATEIRLNGPRYWTMNAILDLSSQTPERLLCFDTHYVGNFTLSRSQCKIGSLPYSTHKVQRDTVWQYNLNQPIYALTNVREKKTYVMQSYSQQEFPLQIGDLPYLHEIKQPPKDWVYQTFVLKTSAQLLQSCGEAEIIQDNFRNTYQLWSSHATATRSPTSIFSIFFFEVFLLLLNFFSFSAFAAF